MPKLPPSEECTPVVSALLAVIAGLRELLQYLQETVQALRDEIAVLKHQKKKPAIRPSKLTEGEGKKRRGKRKKGSDPPRLPDRTVIVKPDKVPEGSRFKGYGDYTLQELVIKTETTLYRVEKWLTPEGKLVTGEVPIPLPEEGPGDHFGPVMRCFVLYQYYHAQVTEPLLLRSYGRGEWRSARGSCTG